MSFILRQPVKSRKTKIVATIGPASRSEEMLTQLIKAGTNLFRLNFSHGSHDEHLEVLQRIRKTAASLGATVGILQDLSGPKIRITAVEGEYAQIADGASVTLSYSNGSKSSASRIFVEGVNPEQVLRSGHKILLADGIIELEAKMPVEGGFECAVTKGGRIRSRVGIAFPDSKVDVPATTDKDLRDLDWGIENGVDFVAISFVKNSQDILLLRDVVRSRGKSVSIIAKIERRTALENIIEIIDASDGIMVARGDLGMELPLEQIPMLQKRLIEQANYRGIPVIVATQMLSSMVSSVRPTRAEVSDVASAVMNGADAVMLSEETAIGDNPRLCVEYIGKIACEAEKSFEFEEFKLRLRDSDRATVPDAVAYAACAAAIKVGANAIIACTETGNTARLVAKYRPQQALYGASTSDETLRRMALFWGVTPLKLASANTPEDEIIGACSVVQKRENLPDGSRAVVTGGAFVRTPGATSIIQIREMRAS